MSQPTLLTKNGRTTLCAQRSLDHYIHFLFWQNVFGGKICGCGPSPCPTSMARATWPHDSIPAGEASGLNEPGRAGRGRQRGWQRPAEAGGGWRRPAETGGDRRRPAEAGGGQWHQALAGHRPEKCAQSRQWGRMESVPVSSELGWEAMLPALAAAAEPNTWGTKKRCLANLPCSTGRCLASLCHLDVITASAKASAASG